MAKNKILFVLSVFLFFLSGNLFFPQSLRSGGLSGTQNPGAENLNAGNGSRTASYPDSENTEPENPVEPGENLSDENLESYEEYDEAKVKGNWQILNWEEDSSAVLKYDVEVQSLIDGVYQTVRFMRQEDNSTSVKIQPPLQPGNYRYRFIPYNFFGIAEEDTEYEYFTIYLSYQPEIRSVSVKVNMGNTIYLDEMNDGLVSAGGLNLFSLPSSGTEISFTEYFLQSQTRKNFRYVPEFLSAGENGRNAEFFLDLNSLDIGTYNLVARDASGLESERANRNQIQIKFRKAVDFDVSAGYALPFVIFDDTIRTYFGRSFFPLSATAKISFLPFKRRFGYFGLGISAIYSRMDMKNDSYSLGGNLFTGHLNFIYQFPVRFRAKASNWQKHLATLELHGGIGATLFNDYKFLFPHGIETEPLNSLDLSFTAGASFQFYITNRLYTEAGADFIWSFVSGMTLGTADMTLGALVPSLCVGWQF